MMVCHCNQITSSDIEDAVCCLKRNCGNESLCPYRVYGELGACPNCCGCFPLAEKIIHQAERRFVKQDNPRPGAP